MVIFQQRKIIAVKSLEEELTEARLALGLSLTSVERKIGIGREYLEAIEKSEWQKLPGEIYARNFLKRYASFLGIEAKGILKKFGEEIKQQTFWAEGIDQRRFGIRPVRFLSWPKILKNIALVAGVLVVVAYLGMQIWSLLKPPSLKILYPEDGMVISSGAVKVLGKVEDESWVAINGEEVAVDKAGFFTIDINLNKGLNIIKFEAKRKNGRATEIYRRLVAEEKVAAK
ncbi:hypothetical protein GYA13_02030 [Candidatus Kuenenbacteria bacterium]|nr:hypothetical protein [Candidatus Kuenenbacteria bacterium]